MTVCGARLWGRPLSNPDNAFFAILDLEWTSWQGSVGRGWSEDFEEREIVEIGAVKLSNNPTLDEQGRMGVLTKPVINPELSDYFINLTGITQQQINEKAIDFADAINLLIEFLRPDCYPVYTFGNDGDVLEYNCRIKSIPYPFRDGLFENIRPVFANAFKVEEYTLASGRLPEDMGFDAPHRAHRAVDDCLCVAEALRIFRKQNLF